jgi:hypothetical protein
LPATTCSGGRRRPVALSSGGPPTLTRFRNDAGNADRIRYESLRALVDASYTPVLQDEYALVGESAIELNGSLRTVLDPANGGDIATVFPAGGLASQLRMVARMIKASRTAAIGHRRQVYFASLGGFDIHQNQMAVMATARCWASWRIRWRRSVRRWPHRRVQNPPPSPWRLRRTLNSNGNGTDHGAACN